MRCGILDFSSCTGSDIAADIDHEDLIRHIDLPLMHGVSELLVAIADQNFHIQFLRTCTAHAQGITAELLQVCCDQNRALVEQLPCRCQGETALEAFQELDTQFRLQRLDLLGDGRLGDAALIRRRSKAVLLHYRLKIFNLS